MKHIVNNRVIEIQPQSNGTISSDDLRRLAGVAPDREFILEMPDGSNMVVNPGDNLHLPRSTKFTDAPKHKRG
jgi:hypothetical protein